MKIGEFSYIGLLVKIEMGDIVLFLVVQEQNKSGINGMASSFEKNAIKYYEEQHLSNGKMRYFKDIIGIEVLDRIYK